MQSLYPSFAACLLCITATALPASAAAAEWHMGVVAGLNLSSFRDAALETEQQWRFGAAGALRAEYEWSRASLATEVRYTENGAKEPIIESAAAGISSVEWRLRYLELPLLLKVPLPRRGSVLPKSGGPGAYVMFGPALGVSLGGRVKDRLWDVDRRLDNLRPLDLRMMGTVGVALGRFGAAGFEIRYTEGMTATFDDDPGGTRNAAWSLSIFTQR